MSWGKWITVSFVLFAAFIATLVTVCVRQDVNLVAKDYYDEELVYQQQIDRVNNTSELQAKPDIRAVEDRLMVYFDFSGLQKGEVKLFRPSDPKLDQSFQLKTTGENIQVFNVGGMQKGMYRAKLMWSMNGKEYYFEKIIYL